VRYSEFGQPGFCVVIEGRCRLAVDGEDPVSLEEGDFVLLPATPAFTMSSFEPATPKCIDPKVTPAPTEEVRHGRPDGPPDVRLLGGYFVFDSPDAALLVSLLPTTVHIRGIRRLSVLVRLVGEEASEQSAGRDLVLARLVEVLLIEALRATQGKDAPPGLLRGLADARIAEALRQMHGDPERSWTAAELARDVGMSRSAFFDRFTRAIWAPAYGVSPRLAHGRCEGPSSRQEPRARRGRQAGWLRLGKHVQHRVQPPCGAAAGPICAR
jgi:cupin